MQTQLMGFIEKEEELCHDAEGEVQEHVAGSIAKVQAACDATTEVLAIEKNFYGEHAPSLHATALGLLGEESDELLAGAQQMNLRLVRIAGDGMGEILKACEARLHQVQRGARSLLDRL